VLDAECFVEVDGLWHEISVELVEVVVKKRRKVLWKVLRFLKAGSESISKRGDIRNVLVLADLWFILNVFIELGVRVW